MFNFSLALITFPPPTSKAIHYMNSYCRKQPTSQSFPSGCSNLFWKDKVLKRLFWLLGVTWGRARQGSYWPAQCSSAHTSAQSVTCPLVPLSNMLCTLCICVHFVGVQCACVRCICVENVYGTLCSYSIMFYTLHLILMWCARRVLLYDTDVQIQRMIAKDVVQYIRIYIVVQRGVAMCAICCLKYTCVQCAISALVVLCKRQA